MVIRRLPDGYTIRALGHVYELLRRGHHVRYWPGSYSERAARRELRRIAHMDHRDTARITP